MAVSLYLASLSSIVLSTSGWLSAKLFRSHGSFITLNRHGAFNGRQLLMVSLLHFTLAFPRSSPILDTEGNFPIFERDNAAGHLWTDEML
jgi:hypothetical protein